jgi:6-phosphogluconolactonase
MSQLTVNAPIGYAYVTNSTGNTVSQYIFSSNGVLIAYSSPVSTGSDPSAIVFSPSGQYAYVANAGDGSIIQYSVSNGILAPLATVGANGNIPYAIAIDSTGSYAYVAATTPFSNGSGDDGVVLQYQIGAHGALSLLSPASVSEGTFPISGAIATDPVAGFVYAVTADSGLAWQYAIGSGGALTALSVPTVATGNTPEDMVVDPTGSYAYVVDRNAVSGAPVNGSVSQYTIGSDGSLTPMSAPSVATGLNPVAIAFTPNRSYAYVLNCNITQTATGGISEYSVGSNGSLTPLGGANASFGVCINEGTAIATDPSNQYVYIVNGGANSISQYTIGTNGSLTSSTQTAVAGGGAQNIVVRAVQ